jgi:archaellum biogenesis ATPase FlaH
VPISGAEIQYDGPMWTCDPVVPDDLTGLSMRLSGAFEAIDDNDAWLFVENLNVFLMYASEDRVIRFIDHITGLASDHGITGLYTVARDAISDETYDRIRVTVDDELTD